MWWEGLDKNPPEDAQEWTGIPVNGKEYVANGGKLAHPNSRFTAPAENCPCLSKEFNNPMGVPVTAMVFGGRRAKTAPLVYQSFSWEHGVYAVSYTHLRSRSGTTPKAPSMRCTPNTRAKSIFGNSANTNSSASGAR